MNFLSYILPLTPSTRRDINIGFGKTLLNTAIPYKALIRYFLSKRTALPPHAEEVYNRFRFFTGAANFEAPFTELSPESERQVKDMIIDLASKTEIPGSVAVKSILQCKNALMGIGLVAKKALTEKPAELVSNTKPLSSTKQVNKRHVEEKKEEEQNISLADRSVTREERRKLLEDLSGQSVTFML